MPACLAVRKFSPLIHRTSIDPPVDLPAPFSFSSLLTASAVSPNGTMRREIPKSSFNCLLTLDRKKRLRSSSPAHIAKATSLPRALGDGFVTPQDASTKIVAQADSRRFGRLSFISQVPRHGHKNRQPRKQEPQLNRRRDRLIATALKGD